MAQAEMMARTCRSGAGLDGGHRAVEEMIGIGTKRDIDRLAGTHVGELRFLDISRYPDVVRHEHSIRLAGLDTLALCARQFHHTAGLGGDIFRVGQVCRLRPSATAAVCLPGPAHIAGLPRPTPAAPSPDLWQPSRRRSVPWHWPRRRSLTVPGHSPDR